MIKIINLTPHIVRTRSGHKYPTEGMARVTTSFEIVRVIHDEVVYKRNDVLYLPDQEDGVYYIVSAIALAVAKSQGRTDCLSPPFFTHPLSVINTEKL